MILIKNVSLEALEPNVEQERISIDEFNPLITHAN